MFYVYRLFHNLLNWPAIESIRGPLGWGIYELRACGLIYELQSFGEYLGRYFETFWKKIFRKLANVAILIVRIQTINLKGWYGCTYLCMAGRVVFFKFIYKEFDPFITRTYRKKDDLPTYIIITPMNYTRIKYLLWDELYTCTCKHLWPTKLYFINFTLPRYLPNFTLGRSFWSSVK